MCWTWTDKKQITYNKKHQKIIKKYVQISNIDGKKYCEMSMESLIDEYIVMDDNKPPYFKTTLNEIAKDYADEPGDNKESEDIKKDEISLIVPLYRRIFIDAARADSIFKTYFFLMIHGDSGKKTLLFGECI